MSHHEACSSGVMLPRLKYFSALWISVARMVDCSDEVMSVILSSWLSKCLLTAILHSASASLLACVSALAASRFSSAALKRPFNQSCPTSVTRVAAMGASHPIKASMPCTSFLCRCGLVHACAGEGVNFQYLGASPNRRVELPAVDVVVPDCAVRYALYRHGTQPAIDDEVAEDGAV